MQWGRVKTIEDAVVSISTQTQAKEQWQQPVLLNSMLRGLACSDIDTGPEFLLLPCGSLGGFWQHLFGYLLSVSTRANMKNYIGLCQCASLCPSILTERQNFRESSRIYLFLLLCNKIWFPQHYPVINKCCLLQLMLLKYYCQSGGMAQRVKRFALGHEDLSLNPGTHTVEGENQLLEFVLWPLHKCCDMHMHVHMLVFMRTQAYT